MNLANREISLFKHLRRPNETPFTMTLQAVADRIRNGEHASKIKAIREAKDKKERQALKMELPCIMFAGLFKTRYISGLLKHQGLMVMDFDGYKTTDAMLRDKAAIAASPYIVMAFVSPSGLGLKAVVHIPTSDPSEHRLRVKSFAEHINLDSYDKSGIDVSRVCYDTYDPDIYVNFDAEVYEGIHPAEPIERDAAQERPLMPMRDANKVIEILQVWFDKNHVAKEGSRNTNVYKLAIAMCDCSVEKSEALHHCVSRFCESDFDEQEIEGIVESAYKRGTPGSKFFEDKDMTRRVRHEFERGTPENEIQERFGLTDKQVKHFSELEEDLKFWWAHTARTGKVTVNIDHHKFKRYVESLGYRKYYPEGQDHIPIFVKVESNIAEIVSPEVIKDEVLQNLLDDGEHDIWNHCAASSRLFSSSYLTMIDTIQMSLMRDETKAAYIAYTNGVLRITPESVRLMNYISVDGHIWREQIVKRDYHPNTKEVKSDFARFVELISNEDATRVLVIKSTLGYLLHVHKSLATQKAVIFTDEDISDNPMGGSGKSLLINAVAKLRQVVTVSGKRFDPAGDFALQRVRPDTHVFVIDDARKNLDFELLFPTVTEGMEINRKNKDELYIPYELSPKMAITNNYVMRGAGDSHTRRRHEVEIHQYFNSSRTPIDEFGAPFFEGWDDEQWAAFDAFMVDCVQTYLKLGLVKPPSINANTKRLIGATGMEFYEWANDGNITTDVRYYYNTTLAAFQAEYHGYRDLSTRRFLRMTQDWAKYKGWKQSVDRDNNGRYFIMTDPSFGSSKKEGSNLKGLTDDLPF